MSSPAKTIRLDNRSRAVKQVSRVMDELLNINSQLPVDAQTIEFVTLHGSIREAFQQQVLGDLYQHVASRTVGDPSFQSGWKRQMAFEYALTLRTSPNDVPIQNLHAHFFPDEGTESFILRIAGSFVMVKDSTIEGSTTIVRGPKRSGKTQHCGWRFGEIDRLKTDHIENGSESILYALHNWRRRQRGEEPEDMHRLEDDASIGPTNLGEEKYKEWRAKLGLYAAEDVAWVTNIAVMPNSPHIKKILYSPKMTDVMRHLIMGFQTHRFNVTTFDEAAAFANKKRQMKTAYVAFEELFNTNRKDNSALEIATQDDENQLSDEIRRAAQTVVSKPDKEHAIYTVKGIFVEHEFRDVPPGEIKIDTLDRGSFLPDIVPSIVWNYVAELRRQAVEGGDEWSHADSLREALDYITKNRSTEADIAQGKSPWLQQEIRAWIRRKDPATSEFFSNRKIAIELELNDDAGRPDEKRVAEEREKIKQIDAEAEARKAKKADPEESDGYELFRQFA